MKVDTKWIAVLCAAWLAAAAAAQQEDVPSEPKPAAVAKLSEGASEALAELKRLESGLKGKRGPERMVALQQLAERCESVASTWAGERRAAAQAWYEAGEAWRRHGSPDQAAVAYQKALDSDDGRYRGRALYELAQMQRRLDQHAAAVETYRRAAEVDPESNRAHDARVWLARCLDELGKGEEAIAAYRAAVEAASRTRQLIDASNWLAKALIRRGDLEGAAAAIDRADRDVRAAIDAGEERAALEKALAGMSARKALQRVRDETNGAARDAVELEESRK